MAWISSILCLFVGVFMLAPAQAQAQSVEALWRIENVLEPTVPPAYNNNISPFPIKQRPVERVVEPEQPEIDPQEAARAQSRALRAASLLSQIREILRNDSAFSEDVSGVKVAATSLGFNNNRALINGQWVGVGEEVRVPVVAAERVTSLLAQLEGLDSRLADIVRDGVEERLQASREATIEIVRIEPERVIFKNNRDKDIVISFQAQDW